MNSIQIPKRILRVAKPLTCSLFAAILNGGCHANFTVQTSDDDPKIMDQKELDAKIDKLEKLKIASGKELTLLRTSVVVFGKGSTETPAVRFTYITDLPKTDIKDLKLEATQIWDVLRPRADKMGNSSAVVTAQQRIASDPERDLHDDYTFGWRKQTDGKWKPLK